MPSTVGLSPPPVSPRKSESTTPKRKTKHSTRPAPLSRRATPQYITKLGAPKSQREQESRNSIDDDGAESFPNYCTYCEKQIDETGSGFLYCSESCRQRDLNISLPQSHPSQFAASHSSSSHTQHYKIASTQHIPFSSSSRVPTSPPPSPFHPPYAFALQEGPDIIPRASPTMSRPRSYFSADAVSLPTPSTSHSDNAGYASSGSMAHAARHNEQKRSSTALASLRELSSALELSRDSKERERERAYRASRSSRDSRSSVSSDEQAGSPSISRSSSGVWSYMTRAARSGSKDNIVSKTYDAPSQMSMAKPAREQRERWSVAYDSMPIGRAGGAGTGMERPLPPRTEGYRAKSIDLLTPFSR